MKKYEGLKYRIGLDIGIASVGWAVIRHDEHDEPCQLIDFGVRKFMSAEVPKTGTSPAVDRRNARGIRRNIRRKRGRLNKILSILENKLLDGEKVDFVGEDVYILRAKALDELLTNNELSRVIYSIAKHRGFKSNRKAELKDKNNTKLLAAITSTSNNSKNYRTIGEMYVNDPKYFEVRTRLVDGKEQEYRVYKTRNTSGSFENTLLREDVIKELETILNRQRDLGNKRIDEKLVDDILECVKFQKSYDEGPDLPSPYHVDFKVGNCTFFKDEKRAPKCSFSYEYFTALCDINHMTVNYEKINSDQKALLISAYFKYEEIKYGKVRKILNLTENDKIGGKSGSDKDEKVFIKSPFTHSILKILEREGRAKENAQIIDDIGTILSLYKSDERRMESFNACASTKNLKTEYKENLCALDANKFGNLSFKALNKIIPHLEQGKIYTDACHDAELTIQDGEKANKLIYNNIAELADITSPVSRRSISQTIKVVNAIIDKYGSPCAIYVELAREMSKNFEERRKIEKNNENNAEKNEAIVQKLKDEFGITAPTGTDILKYKLYEQQDGKCAYSMQSFEGFGWSMSEIFSNNNTQIDHIIPYSRCYDDSFSNKVLVLSSENQKKGNRLPFEYFGDDSERWQKFEDFVNVTYKNDKAKREKLLRKSLNKSQEAELNNRALNDTRYISKFVKNMFERYLKFCPSEKFSKKPVRTVNGATTSFLRKIWGIKKVRFEDDKHHAIDACVIACTDDGMLNRVSKFLQAQSFGKANGKEGFIDNATGEFVNLEDVRARYGEKFQMPYSQFKKELEIRSANDVLQLKGELLKLGYTSEETDEVRPLNVSRMVNHKVTGPMHEATIRSKKLVDANDKKLKTYKKTPLTGLKLDKNGEIAGYPEKFKEDDKTLYQALKKRLNDFNGDAKQAFKEPFYKPAKLGKSANLVKSVKIEETMGDGIPVNGGLAANGAMIRVDVFEKNGKNYFIPVYTIDYYNKKLPNKICKPATNKWPELDNTYTFKFSLFRNDIIKIESKKDIDFLPKDKNAEKKTTSFNNDFFYYTGADRSTASFSFDTIDGKYTTRSVGMQTLKMEKYEIDILGNIRKVKHETRKEFK